MGFGVVVSGHHINSAHGKRLSTVEVELVQPVDSVHWVFHYGVSLLPLHFVLVEGRHHVSLT